MSGVLLVAEPVRRKGNSGARLVGTVSRPGGRGVVSTLRKVGAPQGRMLASGQSGRPAGKCHREQTADGPAPWDRAQVRVKRCGKSAPAAGVTWPARQTPSGARPNRERAARPLTLPGRPHRWMVTHPDPRKGPVDRTPPIGRLTVTHSPAGCTCAYLHLGAPSRRGSGLSANMARTKPTSTKVDSDGPNPDLRKVQPRRLGGSHS